MMVRLVLLTLLFSFQIAQAAEPKPFAGFQHDPKKPISITADQLDLSRTKQQAAFRGNVQVQQANSLLTADELEVFYTDNKTSNQKIQRFIATGNVKITNGSEVATGQWARYDLTSSLIEMGGKVMLEQQGNHISGDSLIIDLKKGEGKVKATPGSRVKTLFMPKD